MTPTAEGNTVLVSAAGAAVTITSGGPEPIAWARRWFDAWWRVETGVTRDASTVHGEVDPDHYSRLTRGQRPDVAPLAAAHIVDVDNHVVYQRPGPGRTVIIGAETHDVARAVVRAARQSILSQLHAHRWEKIDAAAATRDGRALLAMGAAGTGRTSVALLLARARWAITGTEAVLARPTGHGLELMPWPTPVRVGLGLADALGQFEDLAERILSDPQLQALQTPSTLEAIRHRRPAGTAVIPGSDLASWWDLIVAPCAYAAAVVHPTVALDRAPSILADHRTITQRRDLVGPQRAEAIEELQAIEGFLQQRLPHVAVRLGADPTRTGRALTAAATSVGL